MTSSNNSTRPGVHRRERAVRERYIFATSAKISGCPAGKEGQVEAFRADFCELSFSLRISGTLENI